MMKKLLLMLAVLIAAATNAQTAGDVLTWKKGAGLSDVKTYTTPVNSSLFSLNGSGAFALIAQSNFANASHVHTASAITDFNSVGDARWSLLAHTHTFASLTSKPTTVAGYGITDFNSLGDARWSLLAHTHPSTDITGLGTLATQSGTFSGTSSGTNTGDQYGSTTASTLIGRGSASGAGAAQEITLGSGLSMTGTMLSASSGSGTVTSVAALTLGTTGTDLSSTVANGTTTPVITLNVPTASASNRGALSAADWSTFNAKQPAGSYLTSGGALGTPSSGTATNLTGTASGLTAGNVTTNANLTGPITSVGNATTIADAELSAVASLTSAADKIPQFTGSGTATTQTLEIGTEVAYSGTDTYTAGGQPSGASNKRQFYTQVGNQVTWQISITWANTSTTCTNVTLTFPTQFPTPVIPTGFTGASVKLYQCLPVRCITTPSGTITNGTTHMIVRNSGDTGFEISGAAFASGSYRTFIFGGTYFTTP